MIRGLRYQDKDTAVHRLNPVVKLAWAATIIILSLIFEHPLFIMLLLLAVALLIKQAGVWREWTSILKLGIRLGFSIVVINALVSYHGDHALVTAPFSLPVLGRPMITLEAIAYGAAMALKLVVIISSFALINLTVHPDDIMLVMLKMKFPGKSVLVVSLSTRFIPCLIEDTRRINDAYRTRGVSLDTGGWFGKLKNRAGIIIPLLANSLDRSVQVAEAMEARAFGTGRGRSFYRDIGFSMMDVLILTVVLLACVTGIVMRSLGYGEFQYYPGLEAIEISGIFIIVLAILTAILLAVMPLASIRRRIELD